MSPPNTPKQQEFALLIAKGHAPSDAAMLAGYKNRRWSRAAETLAQSGNSGAKPPRPAETPDASAIPKEQPGLRPELTEDEWMAKYAPHLLAKRAAGA